jgi:hypothetical protein
MAREPTKGAVGLSYAFNPRLARLAEPGGTVTLIDLGKARMSRRLSKAI